MLALLKTLKFDCFKAYWKTVMRQVILTLIDGSFEQGFIVILRINENDAPSRTENQVIGRLPPAPNILLEAFNQWQSAYDRWQSVYRQTVMQAPRIKPKLGQVTNFSCHQLGSNLAKYLNEWLDCDINEWQKIRQQLLLKLSQKDEIQVIIQTEDLRLRQLPWHLWKLFDEDYKKAEIALGNSEYQTSPSRLVTTNKVRILAILGDSTGINVQADKAALEQLPNAEITFLTEPQRKQLNNQLWDQQWDILFFAGHSFSEVDGSTGQISINRNEKLSLKNLKNALTKAIGRGLQLAIFNSCDGLGLAQELADLHIPQIIVMRKSVPDLVAQEFLKHFLKIFAQGTSLYLSVREAREKLQGIEDQFPCATWLPVICQNPVETLWFWPLSLPSVPNSTNFYAQPKLKFILLSLLVTGSTTLGLLRGYDFFKKWLSIYTKPSALTVPWSQTSVTNPGGAAAQCKFNVLNNKSDITCNIIDNKIDKYDPYIEWKVKDYGTKKIYYRGQDLKIERIKSSRVEQGNIESFTWKVCVDTDLGEDNCSIEEEHTVP